MGAEVIVSEGIKVLSDIWNGHKNRKVQKKQIKLQKDQLEFEKAKYTDAIMAQEQAKRDWDDKYGSIEKNMLHYIESLDATNLYRAGVGGTKASFARARENMGAHLAARGLDVGGGVTAQAYVQLAELEAVQDAEHYRKAEEYIQSARQSVMPTRPGNTPVSSQGIANATTAYGNTIGAVQADRNAQYNDAWSTAGRYAEKAWDAWKDSSKPKVDNWSVPNNMADQMNQDVVGDTANIVGG